jgi:glyoxylate/hydroxypyruvate reductase A
MNLLLATTDENPDVWVDAFSRHFPDAKVRVWEAGDDAPADFAMVWRPPVEALRNRQGLKAIFNLGAGVDGILKLDLQSPGTLSKEVPVIKVDDAGMAAQMAEYVLYVLLRHFRRFDAYGVSQAAGQWTPLAPYHRDDFPVAVMGLGELGAHVARTVAALGFPARGWSRSQKTIEGVECHAGSAGLTGFLHGARVLVCLLPATPETHGMINRAVLDQLADGAYLINVARGPQVNDDDLLAAIGAGKLAGATLDVFDREPLPEDHPFWQQPRITITPHIAAVTLVEESSLQIAEKIRRILAGLPVSGVIDRARGY